MSDVPPEAPLAEPIQLDSYEVTSAALPDEPAGAVPGERPRSVFAAQTVETIVIPATARSERDSRLTAIVILLALAVLVGTYSWHPTALERPIETFAALRYAGQRLGNGTVPLWNPNIAIGEPFLGNGRATVFYPTMGLFLRGTAVTLPWAWRLSAIIHLFWAGVGTWLLSRRFGARGSGALWRGAVFMLGGFAVTALNSPTHYGISWLPWGLLTLEWLIRQPTLRRSLLLALVTMMVHLAGSPSALYAFLLAGIMWWASRWSNGIRGTIVSFLAITGGFCLGIALAGVQFIPSLGEAWRSLGLQPAHPTGQWLAGMISPYSALLTGRQVMTSAAWVGTLPLVLAVFAILKSARSAALWRWVTLLLVAGAVAAMWPNLSHLARLTLGVVRPDPAPFWALSAFALAMLSGIGFDIVRTTPAVLRRTLRPLVLILVIVTITAIIAGWSLHRQDGMRLAPALLLLIPSGVLAIAMVQRAQSENPWAHPGRTWLSLAIIELLIFALPMVGRSAVSDATIDSAALSFLNNQPAPLGQPLRLWAAPSLLPAGYANAAALGSPDDPWRRSYRWKQAAAGARPATLPDELPSPLEARLFDVRFVVSNDATSPAIGDWPRVFPGSQSGSPTSSTGIYANPHPTQRVWLAHSAEWAQTPDDANAHLATLDPRNRITLDRGMPLIGQEWLDWVRKHGGIPSASPRDATITYLTADGSTSPANSDRLKLNSPGWFIKQLTRRPFNTGPGWLMIANAYDPGWVAHYEYRGGTTPKLLIPADGLVQALPMIEPLPSDTQLVLEYKPIEFKHGIFLSSGAALLWLILFGCSVFAEPKTAKTRQMVHAQIAHPQVIDSRTNHA